jgi:hypothetical protein
MFRIYLFVPDYHPVYSFNVDGERQRLMGDYPDAPITVAEVCQPMIPWFTRFATMVNVKAEDSSKDDRPATQRSYSPPET